MPFHGCLLLWSLLNFSFLTCKIGIKYSEIGLGLGGRGNEIHQGGIFVLRFHSHTIKFSGFFSTSQSCTAISSSHSRTFFYLERPSKPFSGHDLPQPLPSPWQSLIFLSLCFFYLTQIFCINGINTLLCLVSFTLCGILKVSFHSMGSSKSSIL